MKNFGSLGKNFLQVDMNRRGASAAFSLGLSLYTLLVGRRVLIVKKDGKTLIDENDVGDPLRPTSQERSLIIMAKELEGIDQHLYDIGCGLAVLYNNDASDSHAEDWLLTQIQEALKGED